MWLTQNPALMLYLRHAEKDDAEITILRGNYADIVSRVIRNGSQQGLSCQRHLPALITRSLPIIMKSDIRVSRYPLCDP